MTHSQAFTEFPHQVLKCGDSVLTCGICHSSDGFKVWGLKCGDSVLKCGDSVSQTA